MRCFRAALALLSTLPLACAWWHPEIEAKCASRGFDARLTIVGAEPQGCEYLGDVAAEDGRIGCDRWIGGDPGCAQALLSERSLALGADMLFVNPELTAIPVDCNCCHGSVVRAGAMAYRCRR